MVKPLLKGGDVHKFDTITTDKYVVFPYKIENGKANLYSENELKSHQLAYSYLKLCEKELRSREKGRFDINGAWFQFSRNQGILLAEHEKLVAPEISLGGNFSYDVEGIYYATTKIYGYVKKDNIKESYKFLLSISCYARRNIILNAWQQVCPYLFSMQSYKFWLSWKNGLSLWQV
ncbi:hypothetical protein EZS27_041829, partial [termite gut metagenome]